VRSHPVRPPPVLACLLAVATIFGIAAAAAEPVLLDIAQAEVAYDQRTGEPLVSFRFTPDSARTKLEIEAVAN
jgi:hypothetical protein